MVLNHNTAATAVALAAPMLSAVTVWLRLRFRLHGDRERRQYLLTAAIALPVGSRIQEHRSDGTKLTLTIGTVRPAEEQR
jgi:hypothetical protein